MSFPRQESFLMGPIVVETDDLFVAKAVSEKVLAIPVKERKDSGSLLVGEMTVRWRVVGKKPGHAAAS